VGYCHKGKGSRVMSQVDENGLPISVSLHDASAHEVTLAFDLVTGCWTEQMPGIVVGDKAYDSDRLDEELGLCGVEVVAPHRKNRKRPATQDEEGMTSYKGRWKVERFFSWLQRFRRLVVRYERKAANFLGFVQVAAIIMCTLNLLD
jgi:transposase